MDWKEYLVNQLKRHEGFRSQPYKCSQGVWTIGYGFTRGITATSPSMSREQAEDVLREEVAIAIDDARAVCSCFDSLDPVRKVVVANMAYNMGRNTLSQFKNTLRHICSGRYSEASLHMLQSLWARQVKGRARELAKMMATGKYPDV